MAPRSFQYDESLIVLREEERPYGAIVHLFGAVPIWGFVFLILMWLYFKNRSREMIFHIQQAFTFHIVILSILFTGILVELFRKILSILSASLADVIMAVNYWAIISAYTACAAVAIWGAASVYMGRPFFYPQLGRRVLEGSMRKFSEE